MNLRSDWPAELTWPSTDSAARHQEVESYFRAKAKEYDEVDSQPFWAFSDDLLWEMLRSLVIEDLPAGSVRILDAGGGTGRWTLKFLDALDTASVTLVDASSEMLAVADVKIRASGYGERASLVRMNLDSDDLTDLGLYDLAICLHNVLAFVADPMAVLSKIAGRVRSGGKCVVVVPNLYHAAYFSLMVDRPNGLTRLAERSATRFASNSPEMFVFTPGHLRKMLHGVGGSVGAVFGFPVSLYPGSAETRIRGSSPHLERLLADSGRREALFAIEQRLCLQEEAAARGNNLLAVSTITRPGGL